MESSWPLMKYATTGEFCYEMLVGLCFFGLKFLE